jgi:V/A-type H+-transporting ATPase subunit C
MSAAQYAYLHTRVSLYAEHLLGIDRLNTLIDRIPDKYPLAPDIASPSTAASQYSGELDQDNVSILLKELAVLIRPLSGAPRGLLDYWAHRFELGNLKTIIRGKMANQSQQAIEEQLLDMGGFTSLPLTELLQSDTTAELLRRLEQTPYAEIARRARSLLEGGEALFALDAALDRRYFAGLARRGSEVGNASGQLLRTIIGSIIDRVNLVWLLRYRFAYNLPPAQAYYLLIPANQRLTAPQLQQLAQCTTFDEAIASLPQPFDKLLAGARNNTEVTLKLEHETWRIAGNVLKHGTFNVARAFAYMILRERDLRRLRAITRGRDMQMDAGMIRAALGLTSPDGEQPTGLH